MRRKDGANPRFFYCLFFLYLLRHHHENRKSENALKIAIKTGFFIALIDCTSRETAKRTTQRQTRNRQKHARERGKIARNPHGRTNTRRQGKRAKKRQKKRREPTPPPKHGEKIRHHEPSRAERQATEPRHEKRTAEAVLKNRCTPMCLCLATQQ